MRVSRVLVAVALAVSAVSVRFSAQTVNTASFVAGEILVKFRPGTPASARAEAHRQAQGIVLNEISRRGVVLVGIPGAMDAGLTSALFWGSLAFSLAVAFVVTVPFNKWMIGRGRGHAVVHAHHH